MEKLPSAQLYQRAQSLLTQTKQGAYWRELCQAARSETAELSDSDVEQLVKAYYSPIRACNELDVKSALIVELEHCARAYGARNAEYIEDVLVECLALITTRFRGLAVNEIRFAFRLKASGTINPKGAEMYGGSFNAEMLGKILTAYRDWRAAALKPITQKLEEVRTQQEEEERAKIAWQRYEETFLQKLQECKRYTSWNQVPEYLFEACKRKGYINLTKQEADAILERAKVLAVEEDLADKQGKPLFVVRTERPIDMDRRAKIIARKIVVLEHILQNPLNPVWNEK